MHRSVVEVRLHRVAAIYDTGVHRFHHCQVAGHGLAGDRIVREQHDHLGFALKPIYPDGDLRRNPAVVVEPGIRTVQVRIDESG